MGKVEKLTSGTTGGPVFVYVQDGRIIRITPMDLDDSDAASWVIEGQEIFSSQKNDTGSLFLCFAFHDLSAQEVVISAQADRFRP